ncbi:MAG: Na/Pi symporter [Victivallales bacterium]|nr:Na/Pi symporter [Victivallales bacterium]
MKHFSLPFLLLTLGLLLCAGCSQPEDHIAAQLRIRSGDCQMAAPGTECPAPLVVEVLGPVRRSWAGAGHRRPAVGVTVRIEPLTADAQAIPQEAKTDIDGRVRLKLNLAPRFGDQYFQVSCPDVPTVQPVCVHAVAGVSIEGALQETVAGDHLLSPILVHLKNVDGSPLADQPVFFALKSGPSDAKLTAERVLTDKNGIASVNLQTVPGYTGKYEISADVGDGELRARGLIIPVLAMSRPALLMGVLGGLGIFIFGMTMMSDGLQQMAGNRLKNLLQLFTGNRFKAMLAGIVVTTLIQSSGACTVMVVGFVNAALLTLNQGLGIILGSAIGTTVTAQMVSFKLDFLALPAIALGVVWLLMARKSQSKGVANAILGFGLLFYGMTLMSSQLRGIAEFPAFIAFFRKFDCTPGADGSIPIGGILGAIVVGTVMTVVVQSSSATVGVAIAMAESGLLNFYTAVPLILGDNIGSTITGVLGSLNSSRPAQRTAFANTVFKLLSVFIMIPLFYVSWRGRPCFLTLVDIVTSGEVFAEIPENLGRHLASAHTLFNIFSVMLFLPLVNMLGFLASLALPERQDASQKNGEIYPLEQRLLNTPSAALSQVLYALLAMTECAMDLTRKAIASVAVPESATPREEVDKQEERIDHAQHSIINYLVQLTRRNLDNSQSTAIPVFMHCVNDVERIGDRAVNIFNLLPQAAESEGRFSVEGLRDLHEIGDSLDKMEATLNDILRHNNVDGVQDMVLMEAEVKKMAVKFEQAHEARLRNQTCSVEKGVVYVDLLSNLERIAAHLANVGERAPQLLPHSVSFQREPPRN